MCADRGDSGNPARGGMVTRPLVVTVTPNPSLDLLFEAERLVWDDANRLPDPRRRPGGQGINVARAVHALGGSAVAVALLGGRTGEEIRTALESEDVPLRAVDAGGETRTFVAVHQADGHSVLLNARGPARGAGDERAVEEEVGRALSELRPRWLACCGSLPDGFAPDFYLGLAGRARAAGVRVVVDCDGEALRLAAPACDLLVPNQFEAARLAGAPVGTADDALVAARAVHARGPACVALTLGAGGAVLAAGGQAWHAQPPRVSGSAVGAGDVFLAALLLALDASPPDVALRHATATAAAALLSTGSDLVDTAAAVRLREDVVVRRVPG